MTIRASVLPIRPSFLTQVRTAGIDDLGQPVKRVTANGGEPVRDVLRRARAGEELILASYSPFAKVGPYREYGPIFVLANESAEEVDRATVVAGGEGDYLRAQFVIRAYSAEEAILDAALTDAAGAQSVVERFFAREDVAFLHARFPTYGCFAARFDRA
jgi:antitoxin (DNA-binding transcriptional repressor) of toxin-antitoxin stability system